MFKFKKKNKELNKDKKINKDPLKIWAIITSTCATLMLIGIIVSIFIVFKLTKDTPEFNLSRFTSNESSQILDQNNELVADIGKTIRLNVNYDDLPNNLIDAFVATEDARFFSHNGFDLPRFTKSLFSNVINIVTRRSRSLSGGSTFTMQLVKNTYFTDDDAGIEAARQGASGIKRKFQEINLALELEKHISKKNIFELYLNKINFGANGRGIENAANYYFGKSSKDLNLAESALLVGVINSPYYYNPFNYLENATERRDTVLYLMNYHGYINDIEYKLAKSVKVEDLLVGGGYNDPQNINPNQAYIDAVIKEAEELSGLSPYTNPMRIYTHLDRHVQNQMDLIQAGKIEEFEYVDENQEIAAIAIENNTGAIAGILGGRNYAKGGSLLLNHAIDQYKQPGSSIKTILEYPLAFEHLGWSTSHVVTDKPILYRGTTAVIKNFTGQYYGELPLKRAVAESLNTTAIQTLQDVVDKVGIDKVVKYMNDLGYKQVNNKNFNIQYAIGGADLEVSVLQQAAAQAAIMNYGTYNKPHTIRKIEFLNGKEPIVPNHPKVEALSKEAAFLDTELLNNNFNVAWGRAYRAIKGFDHRMYAKTGTSDWGDYGVQFGIPVGATKDLWFVSSSPDYTVAVWTGYEKAIKGKNTYFSYEDEERNIPGHTAKLIHQSIVDSKGPVKNNITPPDGVSYITHILGTFPYTKVIEGMNQDLITAGFIKTKDAKLIEPELIKIEDLKTADIKVLGSELNISWAPYPDLSKLQVADNKIDLSLNENGVYIEFFGPRIFDYSWIFGPIEYKARVDVNNQPSEIIASNTDKLSKKLNLIPGSNIKICAYYAFKDKDIKSNEICKEFKVEDKEIDLTYPSEGPYDSGINATNAVNTWASENGLTVDTVYVFDYFGSKNKIKLTVDGVDKTGMKEKVLMSKLTSSKIIAEITLAGICDSTSGVINKDNGKCLVCNPGYKLNEMGQCVKE